MTKKQNNKNLKQNEMTKENKIISGIKKFFNSPVPLIIFLLCVNAFLILYISNYNSKNRIFVGVVDESDLQIVNVHYFTNGDMNYFYASPAAYIGEDKEIYNFQIGYYVVDKDNNYIELASRSRAIVNKTSLKEVVDEMSGWNFAEEDKGTHFFTNEVMRNLDNLHFLIKACSKPDTTEADIVIDYPVEMTKITK